MLKKNYFLLCLFLLLQGITAASAQVESKQAVLEARPFADMTLEIDLPVKTFVSFEPIPIYVKQSNKTNQPVLGYGKLSFGFTPIQLYAKKIGSSGRVSISQQTPISYYAIFINSSVAPGVSSETKGLIRAGLERWFPEPGIYEIQAALTNDKGTYTIESNKVNIEIKMPTGLDRIAFNLIKSSSLADYIFSGMKFDKSKALLETLTIAHPNTVYAKYSAFFLGEEYFDRKQYSQALLNLIKLENDANFIHSDKVRNYLMEIRGKLMTQQTGSQINQ